MKRILIFLIGFGLSTIGFVYIIFYLNLLTIDYSIYMYFKFIISRIECWNAFMGIILMFISIYMKGDKDELYL